jgi:EAL domain-containing protein (putative c-di-GMP-specific phosphodiesterase class I)
LFEPTDHGVFAAMIEGLSGAARKGPVRIRLKDVPGKPPRYANVFACRLPQLAPNVSCALSLSLEAPQAASTAPEGLMDRAAFEQAIGSLLANARASGLDVELALIEVAGLNKAVKTLSIDAAAAVVDSLSDVLRAEALSGGAAQLQDERFAVMREKFEGTDTLPERLKAAAAEAGAAVDPSSTTIALNDGGAPQTLRALRFTLDHFLKEGTPADGDLAATFRASLDATLVQAKAFTQTVKARAFKLVYQPVLDLKNQTVHHYEALVRFPDEASPADTIRMAEELDLIEAFDLAVTEKAITTLRSHSPQVRIAVKVSGRSFLRPKFLDRLLALTAGDFRLKTRLLFEITEGAALANLDLADERIQRLRRDGFQVCIDDFGAGSASLAYLRHLTVDAVKIDGQYVRQLQAGGRDDTVIRHLTALCQELKVATIAEQVETQAAADLLKSLGVDMGQGYVFGQPLDQIPTNAAPVAVRRKGAVESWG